MSSERISADDPIRLPEWISLSLHGQPRDPGHLAALCEQSASRALGRAGRVAATLEGVDGQLGEGMRIGRALLEVHDWQLGKLPPASQISSLSSRPTGEDAAAPPCNIDRVEVRFVGARLADLRCETITIGADGVVGRISGAGQAWSLELESAADLWVRGEVLATDARDALVAQSPFIVDGTLSFQPGGGMAADGRVRVGLLPLSARIEGKLAVAQGRDLLFSDVSVKVGGKALPSSVVAGKLDEINPVFTVRPLHDAGLPVELLDPDVDGSVLHLHCRAIRGS